jgi:hypothetical protein
MIGNTKVLLEFSKFKAKSGMDPTQLSHKQSHICSFVYQ